MAGRGKNVNSKVDITVRLREIPGLDDRFQTRWKIRALEIDGRSKALSVLVEWQKTQPKEWKKILKVMQIHGGVAELHDPRKVKKCGNPKHGDVYEMRADKGHARLMFFYDESEGALIICTNAHWKGKGDQDAAFAQCGKLKHLYHTHRKKQK